jgi:peptide subunit release factor RF-3
MMSEKRCLKANMTLNEEGMHSSQSNYKPDAKIPVILGAAGQVQLTVIYIHMLSVFLIWPITITTGKVTFYKYCCF